MARRSWNLPPPGTAVAAALFASAALAGCNEAPRQSSGDGFDSGAASAAEAEAASEGASGAADPSTTAAPTTGGTVDDGGGSTGASGANTTGTGGDDEDIRFDVAVDSTTTVGTGPACKVTDGMDARLGCDDQAPAGSFEASIQWTFTPTESYSSLFSAVIPVVANLTDDNGDGEVDLCDTPDVVYTAVLDGGQGPTMYVLDGADGSLHYTVSTELGRDTTPALGDVDGDGEIDIVTVTSTGEVLLLAADGTEKWRKRPVGTHVVRATGSAIALADFDTDGDVEILVGAHLLDHTGETLALLSDCTPVPTAADLDDDGDLEIVCDDTAWHHDGSIYYQTTLAAGFGYPQVADLDGDGRPEVLVSNSKGLTILEHDGTAKPGKVEIRPNGVPDSLRAWGRPAAIHDLDADGDADFAVSALDSYSTFTGDATERWTATVLDASGAASGTAFDFLGDGSAEAMYGDETTLYIFDDTGTPLLTSPRRSATKIELPIVVDVDNDASAEILVVSDRYGAGMQQPSLQVVSDALDRWVPTRRIWNQHTYHVTNVREDGTIPQNEPQHWGLLNTFRTNAQLAQDGAVCRPEPVG